MLINVYKMKQMNVKKNQINIKMQKKNKRDRRMVKNCFV